MKGKFIKKALCGAMALCMSAALSSCGGSGNNGGNNDGNGGDTAATNINVLIFTGTATVVSQWNTRIIVPAPPVKSSSIAGLWSATLHH